jgi:hypothetical protein
VPNVGGTFQVAMFASISWRFCNFCCDVKNVGWRDAFEHVKIEFLKWKMSFFSFLWRFWNGMSQAARWFEREMNQASSNFEWNKTSWVFPDSTERRTALVFQELFRSYKSNFGNFMLTHFQKFNCFVHFYTEICWFLKVKYCRYFT